MATNFKLKTVSELQTFLKERGVSHSSLRKVNLEELCEQAETLGLKVDPDYILEDRQEVLNSKLCIDDGYILPNPEMLRGDTSLAKLPPLSIFDIYNFCLKYQDYNHNQFREYQKMEAYTMALDGFVQDVVVCPYQEQRNYCAVKAVVKPRTKAGQSYKLWIIFTNIQGQSSVVSSYCICKGGMDGGCRHVVATLFDIVECLNDFGKDTVTSQPCAWNHRSSRKNISKEVLVSDMDISSTDSAATMQSNPSKHGSISQGNEVPNVHKFLEGLRDIHPEAVVLDTKFKRIKTIRFETPVLDIECPMQRIESFFKYHDLSDHDNCINDCFFELASITGYSANEIDKIEKGTRGQSINENWHKFREGVLTASNFYSICHTMDGFEKALTLLHGSRLREDALPSDIQFGRLYEEKARQLFLSCHRFTHRKCSVQTPGLIFSKEHSFLACSPDGIVSCSTCGKFLIEIKCMSKHRNSHARIAALKCGIIYKDSNDMFVMNKNHRYYYQILGQMAITGVHKCVLVVYTHKGIYTLDLQMDEKWVEIRDQLTTFYRNSFYPILRTNAAVFMKDN